MIEENKKYQLCEMSMENSLKIIIIIIITILLLLLLLSSLIFEVFFSFFLNSFYCFGGLIEYQVLCVSVFILFTGFSTA